MHHEVGTVALEGVLKSQYHAALAMLRQTVEACPDSLWLDNAPHNPFWRVAYHVLFYAHLYLMPDEASFVPWDRHRGEINFFEAKPDATDPGGDLPPDYVPYTRAEVLAYWDVCDAMIDRAVDTLDLASPVSGFSWYPISKLEHQIVNIRHIQHHAAQLADRLRNALGTGTGWVAAGQVQPSA